MTPHLFDLEFPTLPPGETWPEPPRMTVEEWVEWLEEARRLMNPAVLEEWLRKGIPTGTPFELRD